MKKILVFSLAAIMLIGYATQNTFVYQGTTKMNANSEISIVDSSNSTIYSYTLKQSCTQIIFSSSALKLNETYKILNGSSTVATIKMTSSVTTSGSSGGHGRP